MGLLSKILGSITGSNAVKSASKATLKGQLAATEEGRRQFDLNRGDFAPFRESGVNSLAMLSDALGLNGADPQNDFVDDFQDDPGFQDQVDFGLRGVESSLAARGLGNSGRALKELAGFGQLQKRNAYGDRLNRLAQLAGIGQGATAQGASIGSGISRGVQSGLVGAGNARASGFTGAAKQNIGFGNNLLNLGLSGGFKGLSSLGGSRGFGVPSGGFL